MKTKLLIFTSVVFTCCLWFGNASGPGSVQNIDRTGSPLSPGACDAPGCHSGGNFNTAVALQLLGEDNMPVNEYMPGTSYRLKITISASGAQGFGFQAVALDSSNGGAGEFGTAPTGSKITTIAGREYFEHSMRNNSSTSEINWTAPVSGVGRVTFYAAGNAVNGDLSNEDDQADTISLRVNQAMSSSLDQIAHTLQLTLTPNPAWEFTRVAWSAEIYPLRLDVLDMTGIIYHAIDLGKSGTREQFVNLQTMPSGIYFMRILTPQGFQTQKFIKL